MTQSDDQRAGAALLQRALAHRERGWPSEDRRIDQLAEGLSDNRWTFLTDNERAAWRWMARALIVEMDAESRASDKREGEAFQPFSNREISAAMGELDFPLEPSSIRAFFIVANRALMNRYPKPQPKPAGEAGGWEDAMCWCREEAARIADKFPEEVGPALIEAAINMRFPHDRKPAPSAEGKP